MVNVPSPERVVVLDTETTGLSPAARIVEIAVIEVEPRTGRLGPAVHHLINPQTPIPAMATRIHGICNADVRNQPTFGAIAGELSGFLRGATLAIQNARFDRRVLDAELARSGQPPLESLGVRIVDTLEVSRDLFPLLPKHSLDAICDRVAVDRAGRAVHHGALVDAQLLAETLPKFAREYDAWCALAEAGCARGLDSFERDLRAPLTDLLDSPSATTPEYADRALSRIAAAQSWLRRWDDWFVARAEALVGADGWCCKHFSARWTSSQSASWKDAASAYLSAGDLDAFRSESSTRVLTPHPDGAETEALSALDADLTADNIVNSTACIARAAVLLRTTRDTLDTVRAESARHPTAPRGRRVHAPQRDVAAVEASLRGLQSRSRHARPRSRCRAVHDDPPPHPHRGTRTPPPARRCSAKNPPLERLGGAWARGGAVTLTALPSR